MEESISANENEFTSYFLEHATVSESTVLYRTQVVVENKSNGSKQERGETDEEMEEKSKKEKAYLSELKPKNITEFSVKRSEDKDVNVIGVLSLNDKTILVDYNNSKLKLYDNSGHYLSSTGLKETTWGIARVNNDKFATCGRGKNVFLWTVRGQTITGEDEMYKVDDWAFGIHYNNTYYCILHRRNNTVAILDRQGRPLRKILMREALGTKIEFGYDIHMDRDKNNMYIPCRYPVGVLCISVEGNALWFTELKDANAELWGITEIHGALCVVDSKEHKDLRNITRCLHLISKTKVYMGKLLDKDKLTGQPERIYYQEQEQKIYISYNYLHEKRDIISVYSV